MDKHKNGETHYTRCGGGRVTYRPDWSTEKPWVSYIGGTAGLHFARLEYAAGYFEKKNMRLLIVDGATLDKIAAHFLAAAIWADKPEGTNPRESTQSKQIARAIAQKFFDYNNLSTSQALARKNQGYGAHPDAGSAAAAFGHDLYLTIAGHGTGFWDRQPLEAGGLGERLTRACEKFYCEPQFYRGWLYLSASYDGQKIEGA